MKWFTYFICFLYLFYFIFYLFYLFSLFILFLFFLFMFLFLQLSKHPEIIINASPDHPPLSLKLIQKLLKDTVKVCISIHLHSTVPTLPKAAQELSDCLKNNSTEENGLNGNMIKVRLIWKEGKSLLNLNKDDPSENLTYTYIYN